MSAWKPLALGMVVWAALSSAARADALTSTNQFNWVAYFAGENGSGFAPANTAPAVTAAPVAPQTPAPQPSAPQPAVSQPAATATQSVIANAPVSQPQPTTPPPPAVSPSSAPVNAFINLGNSPYPLQNTITTGNAQAWYSSAQITSLFGGQPTASQIQSFDNTILQRVQQTFNQGGVAVTLTDNPNVAALHTLSLVSNTSSATMNSAIGMTQVGGSGFSFIDKIAPSAQSVDQLEWIVAHNISHELMLAFGVPENYDQTGNYIDSKLANWAMMVSPNSTFSPAAAQALNQALAAESTTSSGTQLGAQSISDAEVPEPATLAMWAVAGAVLIVARRKRS